MFNLASKARPYLGAVVISAGLLTAGGIYSYTRMPSGVYPEVTFPRIAIVAKLADQDVTTMDLKVTRPLEAAVSQIIGVSKVRSKTIRGGSELSVDFAPGTDMARAEQMAWNILGAKLKELPDKTSLEVARMTPAINPILSLVLTGGDNASQLRDYAFYELAPLIRTIPDVYRAEVAGGDVREIEVIVDPKKLFDKGMSAADLADALRQAGPVLPSGLIQSEPFAFQLIVANHAEKLQQIADLVVTKNGQSFHVSDVASVQMLHQDRGASIGFNEKDAVVITVKRRPGGSTVDISNAIQHLLDKRGLSLPAGDPKKPAPRNIQATIVYDQRTFVESAVHNVRDAILIGSLFSILVLLAFLRSWRATLISALAIPITLAITFLFLHWTGETLNLMSLGGLAVAIGLIIDDTVVVIENIGRHLTPEAAGTRAPAALAGLGSTGVQSTPPVGHSLLTPADNGPPPGDNGVPGPVSPPPPRDPVDAASGEITGAVVGSTLTTVLVFVPLAFIVGVYGQFFASLAWSLAIAVLVSMVISLTLIPVFASKFLAGRPMPAPGRIYRFLVGVYDAVLAAVLRVAEWMFEVAFRCYRLVFRSRLGRLQAGLTVLLALVLPAVAFGVLLFFGIPNPRAKQEPGKPPPPKLMRGMETGLMPAMDEGAFVVDYFAPSGTTLVETERMAKNIEKALAEHPDVKAWVRRTGAELGMFATQTSRGDIQVVLRDPEQDPRSLLFKPVRPPIEGAYGLDAIMKKKGLKYDEAGKEWVRKTYRRRPLKDIMDEVGDKIKDAGYGEHQLKFETIQIMQDELNDLSGANKPVEIKIFGPDHDQLRAIAKDLAEKLEKKGKGRGIKEVAPIREGNPDLMLDLDSFELTRVGLDRLAVSRQLKTMFQGDVALEVQESALRLTGVRVRYSDADRFGTPRKDLKGARHVGLLAGGTIVALARKDFKGARRFDQQMLLDKEILLPEPKGPAAAAAAPLSRVKPLSALLKNNKLNAKRTPDEQWRENEQPAIFVSAEHNEDEAGLSSVVADVRDLMAKTPLPADYRWELGGHYIQMQSAFRSFFVVLVVAFLLVFIMLAFQFGSVALPFLIFLTQPLSLVSGLFALWLTRTPLNVSSYMGAILLVGLDMKNGILLVEYIQQLRKQGMDLKPALLLAGRVRFRPILMTSLAAILGLLPLALGIGPGAQMQQPLAIIVIGGLTANMLFTRMIIPVGYLMIERLKGQARVVTPAAPAPRPEMAAVGS
jgi:multidrug efflux pump subunit AcrB